MLRWLLSPSTPAALLLAAASLCGVLLPEATAMAEPAWVRGGLRLNLRSEPGTAFRIIGVLETGDGVELLEKREGWVKVRLENELEGWIPAGYLESERPPRIRLQQAEDEAASLRVRLEEQEAEIAGLTAQNEELGARDHTQRTDIERLTRETTELRANRRWPEWITGASVLAAGMLLGAILHRSARRRPQTRIRL